MPQGVEAISNGVLVNQVTAGGWTTWNWNAVEPMATYLAMMAIGQFDMRSYVANGIKFWDGIDSNLMADLAPAIPPVDGSQMLWSQQADAAYKRVTRTFNVPPGGAQLTFQVLRDTEEFFDFFFVEARTAGGTTRRHCRHQRAYEPGPGCLPVHLRGPPLPDPLPDRCAAGPRRPEQP